MKPFTEQELLWGKDSLTIEEAAILLSGERHSRAWLVAESKLKNAIYAGELEAAIGFLTDTQPFTSVKFIRMRDFKVYFQTIREKVDNATPTHKKNEIILLKSQQQDKAILDWLKDNKHDPLKLPVPPSGKAGVKKLCRDAVNFSSSSVFNTAWDRLRLKGEIIDAKQDPPSCDLPIKSGMVES